MRKALLLLILTAAFSLSSCDKGEEVLPIEDASLTATGGMDYLSPSKPSTKATGGMDYLSPSKPSTK